MATKIKTFVLTVSINFPQTHKRKGEPTLFDSGIIAKNKIHTIRSNYVLWLTRIKQVQEGKAILSIRYWSGKPYNSKQVVICQLDKDSGIGVQKLEFTKGGLNAIPIINEWHGDVEDYSFEILSKNDGLSFEDFKEWFKGYDLSEPMAIIHFTKFRY